MPMPPEAVSAVADATGLEEVPAPPASVPPASPEAFAPGWALACAALFGGTSSPTGSTLPAALKPQSKSWAVSL